ncbi:MAG: HAD family hydrolase [Pelagibacteraceae bacterium]|jgi:phosphoglycolate phosphatase|nr:HAD family hydrolase [Pelagibacteraceae bacterium]
MTTLWIFDFDGTLVDSEPGIKKCYVKITEKLAPSRVGFAENILIGPTLLETANLILSNQNEELISEFVELFIQEYDQKILLETKPYKYATEALGYLTNKNDEVIIATNKRGAPTRKLINFLGWNPFFNWIGCMDEFKNYKNKSDLIKNEIKNKNKYEKIYFVGDTVNDGKTANENNIPFIFAKFGYGKKQDWSKISIIKTISSLKEIIDNY